MFGFPKISKEKEEVMLNHAKFTKKVTFLTVQQSIGWNNIKLAGTNIIQTLNRSKETYCSNTMLKYNCWNGQTSLFKVNNLIFTKLDKQTKSLWRDITSVCYLFNNIFV